MLVEKLSDILVSWVSFRVFTIQRSYETPRQGRTSPAGTHVMLGGLLCPHGGLGTNAAVEGLFMPTWCCCCGELMLLWDGSDETERWKLAVLDTKKSSPMDSVFKAGNRVHWTQFLCRETESVGLVFCLRFFLESNSAAVEIEPSLLELLETKIV